MGFSRGGWLDWLRKTDKRWLWIVLGSRWIGDRVPDYGSSRLDCRLTFARRLPWCRALPSPWIIHPKLSHTAGTVVRITMRRQLWSFYRQFRFLAFHSRQITPTTHLVLHPHADPCRWGHGSWWLWKKEFFCNVNINSRIAYIYWQKPGLDISNQTMRTLKLRQTWLVCIKSLGRILQ